MHGCCVRTCGGLSYLLYLNHGIVNRQEERTSAATHLEALRLRTAEHQEAATLARREARRSRRCVKALEARCLQV